ncbi:MAG: endonuclease III [Coriobacteriia bacterium]|nr:endonuclease III [Coriobacteriia bacterium]
MPRESQKSIQARALVIAERMRLLYPDARCALDYENAFSLLVAVILSAQTTDKAVNLVTPELFSRWPDAATLANADQAQVEQVIKSIGLYKVKARHVIQAAQMIVLEFASVVPSTLAELMLLPGVGRKTANVVLTEAYGLVEGIAVDTHVYRIAHRLRFVAAKADSADKVEQQLLRVYPQEYWGEINLRWVLFGRDFCAAASPQCSVCPLADVCPAKVK